MKVTPLFVLASAALLAGCAAHARPPADETSSSAAAAPPEASSPLGSPFGGGSRAPNAFGTPLVLDRTDLRIGTTVQFDRMPTRRELNDLNQLLNVVHVVLSLPEWPSEYAKLQELDRLPPDADLVVVLPGYPPSRGAAEAWNLLGLPTRIVVVVHTPPPSPLIVDDLNTMRGLERVVAELDEPSRSGFERLQRPLSFRKVIE